MNMRLACDLCGCQPCMCREDECRACNGEGERYITPPGLPRAPNPVKCEECKGDGWIKCSGPRSAVPSCPFSFCYCEAAWERQQEYNASEPPPSARERQEQAQRERDALRGGFPI